VSHHPPVGVSIATSPGFTLQLEMELKTKFKGNSSDVFVSGATRFFVPKFGDEFTWNHLDTCAHNIVVGWMWIDHYGTLEVTNKITGDKGVITFTRSGWLGAGRFELAGDIVDKDGRVRLRLKGKWNEVIYAIKVDSEGKESNPIVLWKKPLKQPDNKWGWPKFVENLNTMSDSYKDILPPTDSRLRGDRFYLEKDDLEMAGSEKHRLEEKQRAEKKERELNQEEWQPKYFKKVEDPDHGHVYQYIGQYWEDREERIKKANSTENKTVEEATKKVENLTVSENEKQEE